MGTGRDYTDQRRNIRVQRRDLRALVEAAIRWRDFERLMGEADLNKYGRLDWSIRRVRRNARWQGIEI